MPMDGILLSRIVDLMNKETPMRINRITQPSEYEFLFQCFGKGRKTLYISTHPRFGRLQFTNLKASSNIDMTHFLTILRKYLDGGTITKIHQKGHDRIMIIEVDHRDELGVIRPYQLILELMGRYANLILVGDDGKIIDATKRMGSFESSDRAIVGGAPYTFPDSFEKKDIENLSKEDKYLSLRKEYEGISPVLEQEITKRLDSEKPEEILNKIFNSETLFVYEDDYHILELTHKNKDFKTYPLMDGLDDYYKDLLNLERIKSHTGNLMKVIRRELKRTKSKLPKLYTDLENAENSDHFRMMGDLLFAYHANAKSGIKSVTLQDFEGQDIEIELDEKLNGKDNANKYFTRYRKAKNSLSHLEHQIEITENRIEYLERVLAQTEIASVEDAQEIKQELIEMKFLRESKKDKKQKKSKRPNYKVIEYDENTTIFVGKNNLQNDTITFKLGKKEDLWFHVSDTFGSHVLLKTNEVDDEKLKLCANLAAYYSDARNSSNVSVSYTEIKNIKKIPGANPGTVRFSTHKSLVINPDLDLIQTYLNE